jgi:D-arabinose 1-dehydrogenase-like Zn-dependent alcohol dehydrogenase
VIVPNARYLLPHEGIPQALAATYTCSITAFSALKKTRDHLGADDHLVIVGAGGVGGSAVDIAPAAVAGKMIVADIDAQKRAQARQMGAVATTDNGEPDAVKQVMAATGAVQRRRSILSALPKQWSSASASCAKAASSSWSGFTAAPARSRPCCSRSR